MAGLAAALVGVLAAPLAVLLVHVPENSRGASSEASCIPRWLHLSEKQLGGCFLT